jgi:hypothetical protein
MENNMKPYRGRPNGSPNKITNEIRIQYSNLIAANIDRMQTDLDSLKPRERLEMIIALSRFVVPTMRAVELKSPDAKPFPAFAIRIDGQIDTMDEPFKPMDISISNNDE